MTTVLHSLPRWLPLTSPWLYNQVRHLPRDIRSVVACEEVSNLDEFRIAELHSLDRANPARRLLDKGFRRLGVRRHLGLTAAALRRSKADVLHSHWGDWGWRDVPVARRGATPHVVTFYGKDVNFLPQQEAWRVRYRELFEAVDRVLCEGPHMASCIVRLGCPERKVEVHHLGVEVDAIPFRPRSRQAAEPLRALIAASFREKKGIPDALEALAMLRDSGQSVEITIIGDASEDARSVVEKRRILETIERRSLTGVTRMLGYQPHARMLEEAATHHVFMSPSVTAADGDTEGGAPVSLIEMAASGLAIVSTTHCDIPEVVLDGVTGLLAPERDPEALFRCLQRLLDDRGAWLEMTSAGRRLVESTFDVRTQSQRLGAIYRELASRSAQ